jgi:hypothetical protein
VKKTLAGKARDRSGGGLVPEIESVSPPYKGIAVKMNPTTEKVFKTASAIKKNLELVAKASAYLNFIKNASTGEHLELELGDQLSLQELKLGSDQLNDEMGNVSQEREKGFLLSRFLRTFR